MILKNKLDKSFGQAGSAAGLLLFVVGLIALFFSNIGLVLFLLGAFLAFTYTGTTFDTDKKRIRNTEYVFGLIPHGKWIDIEPDMMLGIKKWTQWFKVFSQSNKSLDLIDNDYRIVLYNFENEEIMAIQKFKNQEAAKKEIEHLTTLFGLNILSQGENKA